MKKEKVIKIFEAFYCANAMPTTELIYSTPFELLIAVMLSAQATDISVNKATAKLFPHANTPEKIVALGEETLKTYIKTIGLFNTKAKNILTTCAQLITQHQSHVPTSRDALEALPGVGRKTANVILNTAFGLSTIAVDTHIFRVCNRTELAPGKTPLDVEKKLMRVVPKKFQKDAHHWLILHGRYTCVARKPKCTQCLIQNFCAFKGKTTIAHAATTKHLKERKEQ